MIDAHCPHCGFLLDTEQVSTGTRDRPGLPVGYCTRCDLVVLDPHPAIEDPTRLRRDLA